MAFNTAKDLLQIPEYFSFDGAIYTIGNQFHRMTHEVFDFCFCEVLMSFEAFLVVGVMCETELAKREDRVFHKPVRLLPA